jgi:hypothetical protein|tara:strand:+ start:834 stop:1031 length:198 start_codon:yes stop_codon:yes gene_type:complete
MIKEYTVVVARDITESTTIYVNANSIDEAEKAALLTARMREHIWDVEDMNYLFESPYVTDISGGI